MSSKPPPPPPPFNPVLLFAGPFQSYPPIGWPLSILSFNWLAEGQQFFCCRQALYCLAKQQVHILSTPFKSSHPIGWRKVQSSYWLGDPSPPPSQSSSPIGLRKIRMFFCCRQALVPGQSEGDLRCVGGGDGLHRLPAGLTAQGGQDPLVHELHCRYEQFIYCKVN